MTSEMKQAFTLRVSQANKSDMIVILYEMLLAYVADAREALKENNRMEVKESIRKARGCNQELMESLDLDYEIASRLLSLYTYVNRELILCEIRKSEENLDHVEVVIKPLLDAYREVAKSDSDPAIMMNAQQVVAGLTYGPGSVVESLSDQGSNRGFLA